MLGPTHFPPRARRLRTGGIGLALAGALCFAAGVRAAPEVAPALVPAGPERTEFFALVEPGTEAEPAALAVHRRRETPEGWQLELEVHFRAEGVRVLIVECLTEEGPRHVYRELAPAGARTVLAEWRERGRVLHTIESAVDGSLREACDARRGAVMPLYLIELLRAGHLTQGALNVFDPLARGLERLRLVTSYGAGAEAPPAAAAQSFLVRTVELLREDGSLAGRYEFHDGELGSFAWQTGGLVARRIGAEEYRRLGGGGGDATGDRATRIEALEAAARAGGRTSEVKDVSRAGHLPSGLAARRPARVQ